MSAYLKVENIGVCPPEAFTVLGVSLADIYWREETAEAMLQIRAQVLTNRWNERMADLRRLRSKDARTTWQWTPQNMSSKIERDTSAAI